MRISLPLIKTPLPVLGSAIISRIQKDSATRRNIYPTAATSRAFGLRTLWSIFLPGDIMLADRLMCSWTEMVMLKQRGVDWSSQKAIL